MKCLYPLALLLLAGCQSNFDQFGQTVIEYAKSDQRIDPKEYEALVTLVEGIDDRAFNSFKGKNGQVDHVKFVTYLEKWLKAKKIFPVIIMRGDANFGKASPFNVNVFLENSVSMDGYVKGVTNFETAIYNLLADISISGICDSLNLNYINKSIPYQKKNARSPEIQDFIENLEPITFKQRGGDRSVSDLKKILDTLLHTVDDRNAAILISDFVFSPGNKANAQEYLSMQSAGIKMSFAEKIKKFDLAAVIVQLESTFDGVYYTKTNTPIKLTAKRPYYIWILGSKTQVKEILQKKIIDNIKGGYLQKLVLHTIKDEELPTFKIMYKPLSGDFNAKQLPQGIITDASLSREGKFGFAMAADFTKGLMDGAYLQDTNNYVLSNKHYHLAVTPILDKNNPALNGFTHLLHISSDQIRDETLEVSVIGKSPSWVNTVTSMDDSNILQDDAEKQRTFGFKYLVEGVCDALYPPAAPNAISKFSIQIKK